MGKYCGERGRTRGDFRKTHQVHPERSFDSGRHLARSAQKYRPAVTCAHPVSVRARDVRGDRIDQWGDVPGVLAARNLSAAGRPVRVRPTRELASTRPPHPDVAGDDRAGDGICRPRVLLRRPDRGALSLLRRDGRRRRLRGLASVPRRYRLRCDPTRLLRDDGAGGRLQPHRSGRKSVRVGVHPRGVRAGARGRADDELVLDRTLPRAGQTAVSRDGSGRGS